MVLVWSVKDLKLVCFEGLILSFSGFKNINNIGVLCYIIQVIFQ